VTNSNQEQKCKCGMPDVRICSGPFVSGHPHGPFCYASIRRDIGEVCGHSRACHAPTREQRLQQHIAERDAFLAEDALSAASVPMVSISLTDELRLALGDAITALEEVAAWEETKAHGSELLGEVMNAESCKHAAASLRKSASLIYALIGDDELPAASTHSQSEEG
jgi:hypothetical protein